jgi:hypothetical protein
MMTLKLKGGLATLVMRVTMNKEYWQAKADLCRDLALIQIQEEETEKEAGMNLMRMTYALSMIDTYSEGKGE